MIKYLPPAVFGCAVALLMPMVGITSTATILFVVAVGAVGILVGGICS